VKKVNRLADARKAYTSLGSIAQQLQSQEENLVRLTDKQLDQLASKASEQQKEIERAAEKLDIERINKSLGEDILKLKKEDYKAAVDLLQETKQISNEEATLLRAKEAGFSIEKDTVKAVQEEVNQRKQANKLLGTSGELLKGINSIAGNFGKAFGLDEVEKKMQKTADEAVRMDKSFSKLRVAAAGIGEAFNQLGNNLLSPTVLLTNMVIGFNKVDKAATDFQQQTGQDLNTMTTSLNQFNGGLITSAEYIKAASDLTKEFGLNAAAVFTPENLSEAASMTKEMGLAGKEAANLARLSKINGGNIKDQNKSIIAGVNSANAQNKTAVAHGQILRDIANTSEGIAISYAGYPDKLAKAATTAQGLGMTLNQLDKISSSLLDFQSSIEAEMQAELLTGRALNLEKARELALSNDLAGVAEELANQGITSANFSQMNRIQQEAQAKALGMSRDEMARMLLQQEMQNGLSEDALTDAQKATLEDLKRVDAQEKFATAVAKLQQALAPVVGRFADILSNSYLIYSVMGVALFAKMPMLVNSAKGFAGGFADAWKNAKGLATGITNMIKGKGTEKLKETLIPKDTDKVDKISKSIKPESDKGEGLKIKMQNIAEGIKSFGNTKVLFGAFNLIPSSIGFIAMIPGRVGAKLIELINGEKFQESMYGLAYGIEAMGKGKVFLGALGLAAASIGLTAMIPGVVGGLLLAASATPIAGGLNILGEALISFGGMMMTGVGLLGLAALTGAAIGLGFALNLASPGIEAFGTVITSVFSGLSTLIISVAEGFTTIFGTLTTENIGPMLLLGPALFGISAGLASVAATGLLALPVIGALTTLGIVSGALGSIFGSEEGAGNEEKLSMAGVEAKLDKLIAIVESGGDVYIDGTKVGKTLSLVTSKMG
jgi:hypothetical protein